LLCKSASPPAAGPVSIGPLVPAYPHYRGSAPVTPPNRLRSMEFWNNLICYIPSVHCLPLCRAISSGSLFSAVPFRPAHRPGSSSVRIRATVPLPVDLPIYRYTPALPFPQIPKPLRYADLLPSRSYTLNALITYPLPRSTTQCSAPFLWIKIYRIPEV
jgi:hypothetical protein